MACSTKASYIKVDGVYLPVTEYQVAANDEITPFSADLKGVFRVSCTPDSVLQSLKSGKADTVGLVDYCGDIDRHGDVSIADFITSPSKDDVAGFTCSVSSVEQREPAE